MSAQPSGDSLEPCSIDDWGLRSDVNPAWLLNGEGPEYLTHVSSSLRANYETRPPSGPTAVNERREVLKRPWHMNLSLFEEHVLRRTLDVLRSSRSKT